MNTPQKAGPEGSDSTMKKALLASIEKGSRIGRSTALAHVSTIRYRSEGGAATPTEVITTLGRHFTLSVTASGGVAGAVAAAPAVGTPGGLALALADVGAFTSAAALYVFALCEVHDIPTEDVERRRALLMLVLLGNSGTKTVETIAGRTAPHWARHVVNAVPAHTLRQVNKVLGRNFVTKYGTKQGILVLGKVVPAGFGAVIGAGGNAAFAQFVIRGARKAFGPAPTDWPASFATDEQASQLD